MNIVKNAAKFADFKHGKTMYLASSDGDVRSIFILGKPKRDKCKRLYTSEPYRICFIIGDLNLESEGYLSDKGVPGHAYDDRIPQIYLNRRSAEKAASYMKQLHEKQIEFSNNKKSNTGDDWSWSNDHSDYYDESVSDPSEKIKHAEAVIETVCTLATKEDYIWNIAKKNLPLHPELIIKVGDVTYLGYCIDSRRVRIEYRSHNGVTEENLMYLLLDSDRVWRSFSGEECNVSDWLEKDNGSNGKRISVLLNDALNQKVLFNDLSTKEFCDFVVQIKERSEEKAVIPEVSES